MNHLPGGVGVFVRQPYLRYEQWAPAAPSHSPIRQALNAIFNASWDWYLQQEKDNQLSILLKNQAKEVMLASHTEDATMDIDAEIPMDRRQLKYLIRQEDHTMAKKNTDEVAEAELKSLKAPATKKVERGQSKSSTSTKRNGRTKAKQGTGNTEARGGGGRRNQSQSQANNRREESNDGWTEVSSQRGRITILHHISLEPSAFTESYRITLQVNPALKWAPADTSHSTIWQALNAIFDASWDWYLQQEKDNQLSISLKKQAKEVMLESHTEDATMDIDAEIPMDRRQLKDLIRQEDHAMAKKKTDEVAEAELKSLKAPATKKSGEGPVKVRHLYKKEWKDEGKARYRKYRGKGRRKKKKPNPKPSQQSKGGNQWCMDGSL
jgi:sulfopyruvate decarboxylase TPP-binding subunit